MWLGASLLLSSPRGIPVPTGNWLAGVCFLWEKDGKKITGYSGQTQVSGVLRKVRKLKNGPKLNHDRGVGRIGVFGYGSLGEAWLRPLKEGGKKGGKGSSRGRKWQQGLHTQLYLERGRTCNSSEIGSSEM